MAEIKEVQEKMKADMEALKDQMASMIEAILSMKRMMESNEVIVSTTVSPLRRILPIHPP